MTFANDTFYYTIKALIVILGILGMFTTSCIRIKYSYKKCIFIVILYLIWSVSISIVFMKLFGLLIFLRTCIFTISVPAILILYFISDHSPWQAVFYYTMQLSMGAALSGIQTIAVTFLNGGKATDFWIRIISYSLCIMIEWFFVRKRFAKLCCLPDKNWRVLSIVPLCFLFLIFFVGMYPTHFLKSVTRMIYIFIITFIMLLIYGVMFHVLNSQYDLLSAQHENALLLSQLNSAYKQFDSIKETEEQLKLQRHDMRFYMASISEMLKSSDIQEALEFIGELDKKLSQSKYTDYCNDKMINAMLSYYIDKAHENGIKTEIKFSLPPTDIWTIDTVDFIAMLSNAFDNAINACKKIEKINERKLYIKTTTQNQYIIEIANTFEGIVEFDNNGLPKATKNGHGIGTRSIMNFAHKNNAMLDYSVDGKWFKLRILNI